MDPAVWLFVYNEAGEIIRKVKATNAKGIHRVTWDYSANTQRRITAENMVQDGYGPNVGPETIQRSSLGKWMESLLLFLNRSLLRLLNMAKERWRGNSMDATVNHWDKMHGFCHSLLCLLQ